MVYRVSTYRRIGVRPEAIAYLIIVDAIIITYDKCVMAMAKHFRDLDVYREAMEIVMSVSELTRTFPADEKFVSKLNDAETEAAETQIHLEIAFRHRYITSEMFARLDDACDKIIAQIVKMIDHADRWVVKPRRNIPNA
jgi:cysteinyl-tRNA synthetase